MDYNRKIFSIVILTLLCNTKKCLHGSPIIQSVKNSELTGQELIKMGKLLNKPLLSLFGETIDKTEQTIMREISEKIKDVDDSEELESLKSELCKQMHCEVWTEWSSCSANYLKTFGVRTRSRKCGGLSSCAKESVAKNETDYQICQGKTCKHTITKNHFCVKLHKHVKKTQKGAQEECQKDGGHLMNIDSQLKVQDISDTFKEFVLKYDVWIDGSRTLPNGVWKNEYGSNHTTFSLWSSTQPDNSDDCKILGKDWKWWGKKCTSTYYYFCEIF